MNRLFNYPKRKKTWVDKVKQYDKTHKVPNWLSTVVIITTIIIIIKVIINMVNK